MPGRSMALDVLVRLKDHMSGPLRSLRNNLSRLAGFARRIGVLGAAIGAISFMGPIQEAAAFQQKLLDIAGTSELTGQKAFAFVDQARVRYEGLALQIGQSSDTIAEGIGAMVAAGGDAAGAADQVIGDIGKATTAANANFADMSNVGISMLNNLKLPADQMRDSLGALVVAGKLGSFELKDMAASFPNLTSGVAKFGVKGREAVNFLGAALQIARKGTADPASAANNLDNFLGKALAPLTKKNFAKHGVDIEAVMMDAAAKGINPIEAVIQKIGKLTGVNETQIATYMKQAKKNGLEGADALGYVREQLEKIGAAGKVGELFQDKQVLDFLVPFLANIDEYKDIKAKVAAATGAITDADFKTQLEGLNRQLARFREIGTQASRDVGFAFGEWLPAINTGLEAALAWIRELDRSTGGMVRKTLTFAGAGLVLVAALGALGFALPIVGAGLAAIGALLGVILSPIGLVIAALGGAGIYIWRNWDRYGGRVMRLWERTKTAFKGLSNTLVDKSRDMIAAGRRLAERYGPALDDALTRGWRRAVDASRHYGRQFVADFRASSTGIGESFDQILGTFHDMGPTIGNIFDDLGTILSRELENAKATINNIVQMFAGDESFGTILGREAKNALDTLNRIAGGIKAVVEAISQITDAVAKGEPIPWRNILPEGVVDAYDKVVGVIDNVVAKLKAFRDFVSDFKLKVINLNPFNWSGTSAPPGATLPNGTPAGDPNKIGPSGLPEDRERSFEDNLKPLIPPGGPQKQSSLAAPQGRQFAAAVPRGGASPVRLDGQVGVTVKIDGPGTVTKVASDNSAIVPSGRMVGRV